MDIVTGIVTCTKCKMRVIPRQDGTCPSCQAVISSEQGSIKRKTSSAQLIRKVQQENSSGRRGKKDPSELLSIFLGLVMLVAIYGIAYFIGRNWTGSIADWETFYPYYYFGLMFVVTHLAVRGLDPEKRGCLRYVGIFILSTIPIAGWIVYYWAGKGLARMLTPK